MIEKYIVTMILFIVITVAMQFVRKFSGFGMFMLDTMAFFAAACEYFMGTAALVVFVISNVFISTVISRKFTPGSFLNMALFIICPIIANMLFSGFHNVAIVSQILFALFYIPLNVRFLGSDVTYSILKPLSNILIVTVYLSIFGNVFIYFFSA